MKSALRRRRQKTQSGTKSRLFRRIARWLSIGLAAFIGLCGLSLLLMRWIDPPFTAVHVERRIESLFRKGLYQKRFRFVPLRRISIPLQHAVIAAEDGRFYQHWGLDVLEMKKVVEDDWTRGRMRGGSTITQQLVKNLFLTTRGSVIRKGFEFVLAPLTEMLLPKDRILELYLNVIEWGPGVYGAEAAARQYYGASAAAIGREQAARLAAIIPSPLRRRPGRMHDYSSEILERMRRMGW